MLDTLITSQTRIKLLVKFFLNSPVASYLRELEHEFHESTNAIRLELNRFENAGLLVSSFRGNKKMYHANTAHPLYSDIKNLIMKHVGIDQVLDRVVRNLGGLENAFITGSFANGTDSGVIDLLLVGENINRENLVELIGKAEKMINRKIRFLIYSKQEYKNSGEQMFEHALLIWDNPKQKEEAG